MVALLAALHVVSSIPTLGSLAKEVGGNRVEVESLGKGYQDPHFVEPKPNLMLVLNRADLLLHVGLELEIGWLPPLVLGSRNPKIQPGELGNLDCSRAIPVLDVPTTKVTARWETSTRRAIRTTGCRPRTRRSSPASWPSGCRRSIPRERPRTRRTCRGSTTGWTRR